MSETVTLLSVNRERAIDIIRAIRVHVGFGLREAKDAYDAALFKRVTLHPLDSGLATALRELGCEIKVEETVTPPDPRDTELASLRSALAAMDAEIEHLRETNRKLNARAQAAEGQIRTTIEDCRRQGVSLGRGLANAGYEMLVAERDELRAKIEAFLDAKEFAAGHAAADALRRAVGR